MLARDYQENYVLKEEKHIKRRNNKKKNKKGINKSKTLSWIVIVFCVSLLLIARYTSITSIRTNITQLEKEIEELEKKKINLQANLEGIKSSEVIEEEAIFKLGMNYPEEGQVVYLSVENLENPPKEFSYIIKDKVENIISKVQVFLRR